MQTHVARHFRFLIAVIVASAAAVLSLAVAAPASAQTAIRYVALGDSYSSGVGAGSYIGSSGSCDRSTSAYPELWASANDPAACGTKHRPVSAGLSARASCR